MTRVNAMFTVGVVTLGLACASAPPEHSGELLSINGTELFVHRMGGGEPIIVIHGGPVLEHGYLLPHLEPLASSYELIFYDQRLSGRSAGTVDSASVRLATFIDDIEALRMALGLDRVHVIGHSWGGLLAMQYAIQHGEHLRSLVLLNPMSASAERWRAEEAALAQLVTTEVRAELDSIRASDGLIQGESDAIRQMLIASFKMAFYDQASIDRLDLYVPPDYNDRSRQFSYMVDDLMNFDLFDRLAGVTTPTLIVYGAAEPAVRISGPALNEAIENSELVIIERTGHFPFIERPEATLDVIRSFLSESPIER